MMEQQVTERKQTLLNRYRSDVPEDVQDVITLLRSTGADAYLVGGAVRDLLLERTPKDWDVATNATSEVIMDTFNIDASKEVGKSFGVFLVNTGERTVEVAKFRSDGQYSDGCRPDSVEFVSDVKTDLQRRDFTMNAIALNESEVVVPDNVFDDIDNKIVRTVGNPEQRFEEDTLRILRMVRFAAQLDFTIDASTGWAAKSLSHKLNDVPAERKFEELRRLMNAESGTAVASAFEYMFDYGILQHVLVDVALLKGIEQNNDFHAYDVYYHTLMTVENVKNDEALRFAAFLHDIGKSTTVTASDGISHFYGHESASASRARFLLENLRAPNALIEEVVLLVENHMRLFYATPRGIRRLVNTLGSWDMYLKQKELYRADLVGSGTRTRIEVDELMNELDLIEEKAFATVDERTVTKLTVNGVDVIDRTGLSQGREVGEVLDSLTEMVLDDPTLNDRKTLLERLDKYKLCRRLV